MSRLSEVSRLQDGVVTRQQALACGMTVDQIRTQLHTRRWRRLYPGVYATFSGVVPREAGLWAAVLAAGPGATLSHQTAAALVGMADNGAIHVTVPNDRRVRPPGVTVHHFLTHRAGAASKPDAPADPGRGDGA